jgi:hypothetical protein
MLADGIVAAAKKDFGTSRWQLSNKTTRGCGCTQKGRDVSSWQSRRFAAVRNTAGVEGEADMPRISLNRRE